MPLDATAQSTGFSKSRIWTGRILSGLLTLLLAFDSITKLIQEPHTLAAAAQMGIGAAAILQIGAILAFCLVISLIPRTALIGTILLTGYLGGATATNLVMKQSFALCMFPVVVGALLWLGLYLRDARVPSIWVADR
jgi:hypothetical protein